MELMKKGDSKMLRAVKEGWFGEGRVTSHSQQVIASLRNEYGFDEVSNPKKIIAMKGVACTGKSVIAMHIGQWVRCPVVSVDDFLEALSVEKGYTAQSPPPDKEAERLRRVALYALYKTADRHLDSYSLVVIKSRLCCEFELDLLTWLAKENRCVSLVIVECQLKHAFDLRERLREVVKRCRGKKLQYEERRGRGDLEVHRLKHTSLKLCDHEDWYKARSWEDVEEAREDYDSPESQANWDLHLLRLLKPSCIVTRLLLNPFDDLGLPYIQDLRDDDAGFKLPPVFLNILALLLARHIWQDEEEEEDELEASEEEEEEDEGSDSDEDPQVYLVVQFNELRQKLLKIHMRNSIKEKKKNYLCSSIEGESCVFKYWKKFSGYDEEETGYYCGVCKMQVDPREPAYTCHYCFLVLHEPCAKKLDYSCLKHTLDEARYYPTFRYVNLLSKLNQQTACKSCIEAGEDFSRDCASCLFQTHLVNGMIPTIIKHDSHPHFLSLRFKPKYVTGNAEYGCYVCNFYPDIDNVFLPGEVRDEHGGYEHVMKLTYSLDGMGLEEDDYWCQRCYEDMRDDAWVYSCQQCPYYIFTDQAGEERIREAIENRNLAIRCYEPTSKFNPDMLTSQ